ncbi:MAG: protein-(glutamine-N5) methyltransferase, release factor-specific [Proteobacteria bacterium]|nr:protein-(glutamine-N5) methyltransferase, release factor-specific [Pseudomonadota bacterium]
MKITEALSLATICPKEARSLLQANTTFSLPYIVSHGDAKITQTEKENFFYSVNRRKFGVPMAYLLGQKEFYGIEFYIDERALVPRPETELLVDFGLEALEHRANPKGLDLGTGSGVVGISLIQNHPTVVITATDISPVALSLAEENSGKILNNQTRLRLRKSDWYSNILRTEKFDLIVSNPPYIRTGDVYLTKGTLRFEPSLALIGGLDGLFNIRAVLEKAKNHLSRNGWLAVEHGFDQGEICYDLFLHYGFRNLIQMKDLSGYVRLTAGQLEKDVN